MDIIIQSLGFTAGQSLEQFIREKLQQLNSGTVIRARVTLYKGPEGNPDGDYGEIRLEVPGNDLYVKKRSAHFETSVSECVEVLSQQLQKAKEKDNNRQANASIIQDEMMQEEDAAIPPEEASI
jgi:putative sigma-54 modulation protein